MSILIDLHSTNRGAFGLLSRLSAYQLLRIVSGSVPMLAYGHGLMG